MAQPKFSVITPSFNQGAYIKDTIESVLAQRYPNFEHIVMDGGSTDNTVEILKSYPHLQWISEKDGGQSDALNKALAKATGDIIAWINSDDWYAEGVFATVAEELEKYPVLLGSCAVVDGTGAFKYEVPNIERNWFDIMRYWVPYSIPTQPAVFFRRDLLPALVRNPGELFDRELYYAMDYDLWTRLAIQTPFIKRVEKRFAYYRMTESNKTSDLIGLSGAEPEMARVFRRAETVALAPSASFSIILPVSELSDSVERTIESILLQSIQDFEVLIVGCGVDAAKTKELKEFVKEKNGEQNKARKDAYLRYLPSSSSEPIESLSIGIDAAEGRYVVVLTPGALLGSTFLADSLKAFGSNRLGMLLPWKQSYAAYQSIVPPGTPAGSVMVHFQVARIFDSPFLPLLFVARRVALLECAELFRPVAPQKSIRELIAFLLFKGWHISAQQDIRATTPDPTAEEAAGLESSRQRISAELVVMLDDCFQAEPFAKVRAQHGCTLSFDPEVVKSCRNMLEKQ